jgi:hypothetical protein
MRAVGQETPIKVRKCECGESAKVETLTPSNIHTFEQKLSDSTTSEVTPNSPTSTEETLSKTGVASSSPSPYSRDIPRNDSDLYELVGGHIRLAAAKSLGWDSLKAIVLEIDDDQAELAALLDNQGEDMKWLDWDEAIERLVQKNPTQTRESLGGQLGLDHSEVSRAVTIMKSLNAGARKALCENFTAASESFQISESSALRLSGLYYGKPEDLETVEKSLKVALEKKMTEPQVTQLVRWVQSGKEPASFPLATASPASKGPSRQVDPTDPYSAIWQTLPSNARVIRGKNGYELRLKMAPSEAPTAVYSALAAIEHLKETSLLSDSTPADPRFAHALPDLATEGRRMRAIEQGMMAAHA